MNFETARGYQICLEFLRSFELPTHDRSKEIRPATTGAHGFQVMPSGPAAGPPAGFAQNSMSRGYGFDYRAPTSLSQSSQGRLPSASQEHLPQAPSVIGTATGWVPSPAQQPSMTYIASQETPETSRVPSNRPYAPTRAYSGINTQTSDNFIPSYYTLPPSTQISQGVSEPTHPDSLTQNYPPIKFPHPGNLPSTSWRPVSAPEPHAKPLSTDSLDVDDLVPPQRILPFPEKKIKPSSQVSNTKMSDWQESTPIQKPAKKVVKPRRRAANTARAQSVQSTLTGHVEKADTSAIKAGRATAKLTKKTAGKVPLPSTPDALSALEKQVSKSPSVDVAPKSTPSPQTHRAQAPSVEATAKARAPSSTEATIVTTPPRVALTGKLASQWIRLPLTASASAQPQASAKESATEASPRIQFDPPSALTGTSSPPGSPTRRLVPNKTNDAQAPSNGPMEGMPSRPLGEASGNVQPATLQPTTSQPAIPAAPAHHLPSTIPPDEILSSIDTWIRRYQDLPAPQPLSTPKDQLAAYAAKSDNERAQVVDNMICECLQDENFIQLARDVEGSWKRIGLGF